MMHQRSSFAQRLEIYFLMLAPHRGALFSYSIPDMKTISLSNRYIKVQISCFFPLEVCFNRLRFFPSVSWSGQSRSCPVLSSKRIFVGRPPTMAIREGLNRSFKSFLPRGQAILVDCRDPTY